MTLNKYDTEDILHNTFIKVMKGIKSFKGQSTIKTWLFSIAHNECINYFSQKNATRQNLPIMPASLLLSRILWIKQC